MKAWTVSVLLASFLSLGVNAQALRITIAQQAGQTFRLSVFDGAPVQIHTFIEFSTNGVWYPAYFTSSNSNNALVYTATNAGGSRLFRAAQGATIASVVKASWDRLGVTNYVFDYRAECLCAGIIGTVTVISNKVVKVENVGNQGGGPSPTPELYGFTISDLFDQWVSSEPTGGVAMALEFDSNGFLTYISLDPSPRAVDEELIYRIDSFTPLP